MDRGGLPPSALSSSYVAIASASAIASVSSGVRDRDWEREREGTSLFFGRSANHYTITIGKRTEASGRATVYRDSSSGLLDRAGAQGLFRIMSLVSTSQEIGDSRNGIDQSYRSRAIWASVTSTPGLT